MMDILVSGISCSSVTCRLGVDSGLRGRRSNNTKVRPFLALSYPHSTLSHISRFCYHDRLAIAGNCRCVFKSR